MSPKADSTPQIEESLRVKIHELEELQFDLVAERNHYKRALERIADPEVYDANWREMRGEASRALSQNSSSTKGDS